MKFRYLLISLAFLSAVHTQIHAQEIGYENEQSQIKAFQCQIEGRLAEAGDSFAGHIDKVGLNVLRSMALEMLYGVGQKTGSIAPESKWLYAVWAWHAWAGLGSLRELAAAYGDAKEIVTYSDLLAQIQSHLQGLQQGQGIVDSVSNFDAHAEDFIVE